MKKTESIAGELARLYIEMCHINLSEADVLLLFEKNYPGRSVIDFGYKNADSLKASVSKILNKSKFSKSRYTRELIERSAAKFKDVQLVEKVQKLIREDLQSHNLKLKHIRDILQEIGLVKKPIETYDDFKRFKELISKGHTYRHSISAIQPSYHQKKKYKYWFLNEYKGSILETYSARRVNRLHTYLSLKDELITDRLCDSRKANIWTTIGFVFADGSVVSEHSLQLVITATDSGYLRDHVIPAILDDSIVDNYGPELILHKSNDFQKSYENSKPVSRLHIEDSMMVSYIVELGMPNNKTQFGFKLSEKFTILSDRFFFSFLCGLFDGDGCLSYKSGKSPSLTLQFDLHDECFCEALKTEIERRTDIQMRIHSHKTKLGKQHFTLSATTTPRSLALIAYIYQFSGFQLERKVTTSDKFVTDLRRRVKRYKTLRFLPSDFAQKKVTSRKFENFIKHIKSFLIRKKNGMTPTLHVK